MAPIAFEQSMDARLWATEFVERVVESPSLASDEGAMIGWFSNAIMRGYDTAMARRDSVIAGALYEFLGFLTTLSEPITLSGHHEPHRVLELLKGWAERVGLNLDDADVKHWNGKEPELAACSDAPR